MGRNRPLCYRGGVAGWALNTPELRLLRPPEELSNTSPTRALEPLFRSLLSVAPVARNR